MEGYIAKYDSERGFGFIKNNDYPNGLFFHVTGIVGHRKGVNEQFELNERVFFEVRTDATKADGRMQAFNVKKI